MPGGDRTGPRGMGPGSGRGAGWRQGAGGRRRWGGRGSTAGQHRWRWYEGILPALRQGDPETERQALETRARELEAELEELKKRLEGFTSSTEET